MALIKCPECGKENVSDSAASCPNCGYGIKAYYEKIELEKQRSIQEEKINKSKEKASSILKNKRTIFVLLVIAMIIVLIFKLKPEETIHGVKWGMTPEQVEKQENKYSGTKGIYDEKNGYYAVSDVEFYGANVVLMYMFENDKLTSIWVHPEDSSYENVYHMAVDICKDEGLPISFEDKTEDSPAPYSRLNWNTKGTTITLIGEYSKYSPSYYFSLKQYKGSQYGDKYESQGNCRWGSKSIFPCSNEIVPWNETLDIWSEPRDLCYEHGCYVMGCPNGFANVTDRVALCMKHHFLCE